MKRFAVPILSLILVGLLGLVWRLRSNTSVGGDGDNWRWRNGMETQSEEHQKLHSGQLSESNESSRSVGFPATVSANAVADNTSQTPELPKRRPDERSDDFVYRVADSVLSLARSGRSSEIVGYLDGLSPGHEGSRAVYNSARHLGSSRWGATRAEKVWVLNELVKWYLESSLDTPEDIVYNVDAVIGDISKEDKQLALDLILELNGRLEPSEYTSVMYSVLESYEAADAGSVFMEQVRGSLSPEVLVEFSELLHRKRGK